MIRGHLKADTLVDLIQEACEDRERKRRQVREQEQLALGPWSRDPKPEQPENLGFAMALLLAAHMPTRFRCQLSSDGGPAEQLFSLAVQGAANVVLRQESVESALRAARWDYNFGWCALFVELATTDRTDPTNEERAALQGSLRGGIATPAGPAAPNQRIAPQWTQVKYLHPDRFFHDTKQHVKTEWEFMGHTNIEDREVLLERAREDDTWDVAAIESLETCESPDILRYTMARGVRSVDRKKVVYDVVWMPHAILPERKPGPWERGVIYTVARSVTAIGGMGGSRGVWLRKPYYYKGHPHGPYVHGGQVTHTEDTFPLTSLLANANSVAMLNAAGAAFFEKMREAKTQVVYDARYREEIEKLRQADDGAWVPMPNFTKDSIQTLALDGPTAADVAQYQLLQQRVATNLALDDLQRGRVDSDATATAIREVSATVAAQQSTRLDGWRSLLEGVAWRVVAHAAMSDRFFARLDESGRDAYRYALLEMAAPYLEAKLAPLGGPLTGAEVQGAVSRSRRQMLPFVGGDFAENPAALGNITLTVSEVQSGQGGSLMASAREQQIDQLLAQYAQLMVQAPHVNWKQRAREHFAAIGAPGMERLLDEERASALVGMQLMTAEPVMTSERQLGGPVEAPSGLVQVGEGDRR